LSRVKWLLNRLIDILVDIIAGLLLYLLIGDYVSKPLSTAFPYLPTLLTVLIVLTMLRVHLQVLQILKFHRYVEEVSPNLDIFMVDWDKLYSTFVDVASSRKARKEFEDVRGLTSIYVSKDRIGNKNN